MINNKLRFFLWLLFVSLFLILLFIETSGIYHNADLILYSIMLLSFYFNYLSYEFNKGWIKHFIPSLFFLLGVIIYGLLLSSDSSGHGTGGMILLSVALIFMMYFILHLILDQVLIERKKLTNKTHVNQRLTLIFVSTLSWFHFFPLVLSSFEFSELRNLLISTIGALIFYGISVGIMFKIKIKMSQLLLLYFILSFITYRFIYKGETTLNILGSVYLLTIVYLIRNDLKNLFINIRNKFINKKGVDA